MPNLEDEKHILDISIHEVKEELELFAEELPSKRQHFMPPNTFSTLACECETISTFFCYGCGI